MSDEFLYHATYETNVESILESGLKKHTYFANTPGYAAAFLALRGGIEHKRVEKEVDGKIEHDFEFIIHEGAHVFAVAKEDVERWMAPSYDPSTSHYPDDLECWIVDCEIDPDDVVEVGYIEFPK